MTPKQTFLRDIAKQLKAQPLFLFSRHVEIVLADTKFLETCQTNIPKSAIIQNLSLLSK